MLNEIEKQFLKDLSSNEIWSNILSKIEVEVNPFKPSQDLEKQQSRWIYDSGRKYQTDQILIMLRGR